MVNGSVQIRTMKVHGPTLLVLPGTGACRISIKKHFCNN